MEFNATANQVIQFINQTRQNVFLTGNAGTGKTTLVNHIVKNTFKKHVVVAPTGIAALNANGVTIHSMFQLPFACFVPDKNPPAHLLSDIKIENKNTLGRHFRFNATKLQVIQEMELLIIDEVSMLRPDVLDAMDFMMQRIRRNYLPFGGVQVLFVGDLMQLPPVINREEWQVLNHYYAGKFFFHAKVLEQQQPLYIELDKIYRQQDRLFIDILNQLRHNKLEERYKEILNQKYIPNFDLHHNQGYITLTTHNRNADQINQDALGRLSSNAFTYSAEITGEFPPHIYPVEEKLVLKVGAQVMFIKNDISPSKQFFNGKTGVVKKLSEEEILVHFPEEDKTIEVEPYEWENIKYSLNEITKEIEEEPIGTFVQYPIKLAWAITVHKSQGLTFEKAALDVRDAFVSGQLYVAFSRLTSIDGLVLLTPFQVQNFDSHTDVFAFASNKKDYQTNEQTLFKAKEIFAKTFFLEAYNWKKTKSFWHNHLNTYQEEVERSFKSLSLKEMRELYQSFVAVNELAEKFINQLERSFQHATVDFAYLYKRTQDALNYFLPLLREINLKLKIKLIHTQKQKRAKQFYNELLDLDYQLLSVIEQLFRVQKFAECLHLQKEINKEGLTSQDFSEYHTQLKKDAISTYHAQNLSTVAQPDEEIILEKKTKQKQDKTQKVTTYEETFLLYSQDMSIEAIAEARKLSVGTIQGHFAKLISSDKIKIEAVLSPEKIERLKEVFSKAEKDAPLALIKEKTGDEFSWGELKIGQAQFLPKE